jgi:hypothetical protein
MKYAIPITATIQKTMPTITTGFILILSNKKNRLFL